MGLFTSKLTVRPALYIDTIITRPGAHLGFFSNVIEKCIDKTPGTKFEELVDFFLKKNLSQDGAQNETIETCARIMHTVNPYYFKLSLCFNNEDSYSA